MLGGQTANMAVPVVQHTGDAKPGGQHVKEEAPNDQQLFHELRPRSSEAVHPSTTLTELALIKAATVRMDTAEYSGEQKFQIPEDAPTMVAGIYQARNQHSATQDRASSHSQLPNHAAPGDDECSPNHATSKHPQEDHASS